MENHSTELDVQIDSCILEVRVTDERGADLDGIEFHWEANAETGLHQLASRVIHTDARYRLLFPPGTVRLMVRRDGFQPATLTLGVVSRRVYRTEVTLRRNS